MPIAHGSPRTSVPNQALWLQSLRFHLNPTPTGEYRFSHVHWGTAPGLNNSEQFLQELMNGHTIGEILEALPTTETNFDHAGLDKAATAEIRQYFQELAQLLHLHTSMGMGARGHNSLESVPDDRV